MLNDSTTLLPGASYERDPTIDYRLHKAVLYTMATCHSLRIVNAELLGDPLDIKMFEFTQWSFEELAQKATTMEEDIYKSPSSLARPPAGSEYSMVGSINTGTVSNLLNARDIALNWRRVRPSNWELLNPLNSYPSFVELVSLLDSQACLAEMSMSKERQNA